MAMNRTGIHLAWATIALLIAAALIWWRMSDDPWQQATRSVQNRMDHQSLVVISPAYHNREVAKLPHHYVIAADQLSPNDTKGFDSIWVFSDGDPSDALTRHLNAYVEESVSTVGKIQIIHYTKPEGGTP